MAEYHQQPDDPPLPRPSPILGRAEPETWRDPKVPPSERERELANLERQVNYARTDNFVLRRRQARTRLWKPDTPSSSTGSGCDTPTAFAVLGLIVFCTIIVPIMVYESTVMLVDERRIDVADQTWRIANYSSPMTGWLISALEIHVTGFLGCLSTFDGRDEIRHVGSPQNANISCQCVTNTSLIQSVTWVYIVHVPFKSTGLAAVNIGPVPAACSEPLRVTTRLQPRWIVILCIGSVTIILCMCACCSPWCTCCPCSCLPTKRTCAARFGRRINTWRDNGACCGVFDLECCPRFKYQLPVESVSINDLEFRGSDIDRRVVLGHMSAERAVLLAPARVRATDDTGIEIDIEIVEDVQSKKNAHVEPGTSEDDRLVSP